MRQYPECLNRRYQALDDLVKELGAVVSDHSQEIGSVELSPTDPGIKLMCKFWNILKENPGCDLQNVVQQHMDKQGTGFVRPQRISCYPCSNDNQQPNASIKGSNMVCCSSASGPPTTNSSGHKGHSIKHDADIPLSKVLCSLNEAASVDKKCSERVSELKAIQKQVLQQIEELERREKEGTEKMKQADCMWTCMEESYKQKIAESIERQKELMKEQRNAESHVAKWRKNKKELDLQMKHLEKCEKEIEEKMNQKNNDLKCIKTEISNLKKRIQNNVKDTEAAKNSIAGKKKASADKISKMTEDLKIIQEKISYEQKLKKRKEEEGHKFIKEARDDLQHICRILLQKKLENEELKAESDAIVDEIELLKKTTDQCQDKCKNKQDALNDALKNVKKEITTFRARCTKCHVCVDTHDARRFCMDCPKCLEHRECVYKDGQCTEDPNYDCICIAVKRKFLDNVFENMYTVLERQSKTAPGKALAEQVLACLQNSRNGKLTEPIRKALQEFVLTTVKKNLNLTIIGGAVKTRCELEPETYKQLMNCLTALVVDAPEKKDKGTIAKKDSCKRWGGTGECNCPSGPKNCVCTRKAPPPPNDPKPCPQLAEDKLDIGEAPVCPHHINTPCGPDCGNIKASDTVKDLVKTFNPPACSGPSCSYTKNMRAAQCVLGQEPLNTLNQSKHMTRTPDVPNLSKYKCITSTPFVPDLDGKISCICGRGSEKPCSCYNDFLSEFMQPKPPKKMLKCHEWYKKDKINYNGTNHDKNMTATKIRNAKDHDGTKSKGYLLTKDASNNVYHSSHRIKEDTGQNTEIITENPLTVVQKATEDCEKISTEPSKHRDILFIQTGVSKAFQECGTEPFISMNNNNQHRNTLQQPVNCSTDEITPKDLFKVAVPNDKGEMDHEFTELTVTSSGCIQMALDHKLIQSIKSQTKENPNLTIALRKTISGHFIVEFNKCNCNSSESRRVLIKKTDSGSITMQVNKNLIDTIQPSIINSTDREKILSKNIHVTESSAKTKNTHQRDSQNVDSNEKEIEESTVRVADIKKKDDIRCLELKEGSQFDYSSNKCIKQDDLKTPGIGEKRGYHDISKNSFISQNIDINQDRVLIKLVNESNNSSTSNFKFKDKDKTSYFINKDDKRIPAVADNDLISIDDDLASFVKTNSKYLLNFDENAKNTILKRSSTGEAVLVFQDPTLKINKKNAALKDREHFFKVRVKGVEYSDPVPTSVMRSTSSGNFVFVLDSELENPYLQTLKEFVGEDHDCHVCLSKTQSECYIIDFNKMENYNALIAKSQSGNIKMLVQRPALEEFQAINKNPELDQRSSIILQELFTNLPQSSREFHKENLAKSKYLERKSFSDSRLYDKVRIQDQNSLFGMTSAVLRKTSSGKYAVVLNKESKPAFINNLKRYISSSGQVYVPLVKTDQGDIIITLKRDHKEAYGSVKITSSGNVFVTVDESVIKQLESDKINDVDEMISGQSSQSVHLIGTTKHPQDKQVATTCHAQPEKSSCDADKCVCKELHLQENSWVHKNEEETAKEVIVDGNQVQMKRDVTTFSYQMENQNFYVINSSTASNRLSKSYVEQNIHNSQHDLNAADIPVKEIYFKTGELNYTNIYQKRDTSNLDYLDFLPPQLPYFLRNYD